MKEQIRYLLVWIGEGEAPFRENLTTLMALEKQRQYHFNEVPAVQTRDRLAGRFPHPPK